MHLLQFWQTTKQLKILPTDQNFPRFAFPQNRDTPVAAGVSIGVISLIVFHCGCFFVCVV